MSDWRTTCSLLQLISCHLKTVPHTWQTYHPPPTPPHHLHLHFPAKLSHLAGDVDSGHSLEVEGMQTFFTKKWMGQTPPWFSLLQCHLQVRVWTWVESEPQVGLHRYLQVKWGGIQNPVTKRLHRAGCTEQRREGRSTEKRIVPNREPDIHESSG